MKICYNEFLRREGILAVKPGLSFSSGATWSYFENSKLKHCGLIKPFAPGCTSAQSIFEMLNKITEQWEELKGFSIKPVLLCLESPVIYPAYGRHINANPLGEIQFLSGMLTERFKPQEILRPASEQWKGDKPKEIHHAEVLAQLDSYEKKRLNDATSSIHEGKRHSVIDAVGLGLYALPFEEKLNLETKIKRTRLAKMQA